MRECMHDYSEFKLILHRKLLWNCNIFQEQSSIRTAGTRLTREIWYLTAQKQMMMLTSFFCLSSVWWDSLSFFILKDILFLLISKATPLFRNGHESQDLLVRQHHHDGSVLNDLSSMSDWPQRYNGNVVFVIHLLIRVALRSRHRVFHVL